MLNLFATADARECYVCGGSSAEEPFKYSAEQSNQQQSRPMNFTILSCDEFEHSGNINKFIMKCPKNYVGCITQNDGK